MASVWEDMRLSKMLIYLALSVQVLPICSQLNVPNRLASTSLPQLWGDLQPGAFAVGFRTVFRYDDSRTWKLTRSYDGTFSPDLSGRTIHPGGRDRLFLDGHAQYIKDTRTPN